MRVGATQSIPDLTAIGVEKARFGDGGVQAPNRAVQDLARVRSEVGQPGETIEELNGVAEVPFSRFTARDVGAAIPAAAALITNVDLSGAPLTDPPIEHDAPLPGITDAPRPRPDPHNRPAES